MAGSVELHGGDCQVTLWGVLDYMVGVLSYMVESVGLHDGECWVIWKYWALW